MAFPLCAFVSTLLIIKNPFSHSFLSLLSEAATYVTDGKTTTVEVRREGTVQEKSRQEHSSSLAGTSRAKEGAKLERKQFPNGDQRDPHTEGLT